MSLRLHLSPPADQIADDNGVGRIVHAQYAHLSAHDIELVPDPARADVVACHIDGTHLPRVDVHHVHGLYFADVPHAPYARWHHQANQRIAATARRARAITVPSPWVSEVFKRDMRLVPEVIGHGLDLAQFAPAECANYALWNKNRAGDVCDPTPAAALAAQGIPVVSTFGPKGNPNLTVTGTLPHEAMRQLVAHAGVYLATTPETFGIGTLEALAAGVPVLGYRWYGTADLVAHEMTGYLVEPGDTAGLARGYAWCMEHRDLLSRNARQHAQRFGWERIMARYAALYHAVAEERARDQGRVSVVITSHNYGQYLQDAVDSVLLGQEEQPAEIIIVDDGSTDITTRLARDYHEGSLIGQRDYAQMGLKQPPKTIIKAIVQQNQGVAAARNNGIAAALGEYVVCLDADDQLAPDYLRLCADALRADRALGIAYTGLGVLLDDGTLQPSAFPPAFDWDVQATPANPPATTIPTAAMLRRDLVLRCGGYKQVYAPGEDAELYTRLLSIGATAKKVADEPLIHYRVHQGSASRTRQYKPIDTWHPWMRDKQYPFAAPSKAPVAVRSYARPLVSVIIPVGPGHARHLPAALDSLLGQTVRDWEVIVVDDTGSEGVSAAILHPYPFVRLVETRPHHDTEAGPFGAGVARNVGLNHARSPLCLFLDADDWLHPEALAHLLRAYAETGRYAYSDWVRVEGDAYTPVASRDYDARGWLPGAEPGGLHAVTVLMETAHARQVGGFDERMPGWEDGDFFIKCAVAGICGVRVPLPLLYYRTHTGQRRQAAFAADGLHAMLQDRYADYISGKEPLMGCCNGNSQTQFAALQAVTQGVLGPDGELDPGTALMEYTGNQAGLVTWSGSQLKGRYQVSASQREFVALDQDVTQLEGYGQFRLIRRHEPAPVEARPRKGAGVLSTPAQPPASDPARAQAAASEPVPFGLPEVPPDTVDTAIPAPPTPEQVAQAKSRSRKS